MALKSRYNENDKIFEIGVDEVGRGPMFGRVYCAAVILPQNFKHELMKDSKKFTSKKKYIATESDTQLNIPNNLIKRLFKFCFLSFVFKNKYKNRKTNLQ